MQCTYCKTDIHDEALKCPNCQEYTSGITCCKCQSSIPKDAFICKFCGTTQKNKSTRRKGLPKLSFSCNIFPSFVFRGRLIPQIIETDLDKIIIKAHGFFWLWCNTDEIPWNKVAGFSYRNGILWDKIEIETRGQNPSKIIGITKSDGAKLREILQELEK